MKKLLLYLSLGLIIFSAPGSVLAAESKAQSDNIKAASSNVQDATATKAEEKEIDPKTIRNQDFLVPTKDGVQKLSLIHI